jgi:hypothetical protein
MNIYNAAEFIQRKNCNVVGARVRGVHGGDDGTKCCIEQPVTCMPLIGHLAESST